MRTLREVDNGRPTLVPLQTQTCLRINWASTVVTIIAENDSKSFARIAAEAMFTNNVYSKRECNWKDSVTIWRAITSQRDPHFSLGRGGALV